VFFGERPRMRQLVGVALVIVAVSAIAAVSS
jgi:drug/metabolite transporter (DMT)-like permease